MLETSIDKLADAINRWSSAIEALVAQPTTTIGSPAIANPAPAGTVIEAETPEPTPEPAKKKAAKKPETKPEPTPEPVKTAAVSKDQLRVAFGQLSKAKGGNAVKAILNDFGFEGFSTVPDNAEEIEAMYRTAQEQLA